jgi:hypothetical protein
MKNPSRVGYKTVLMGNALQRNRCIVNSESSSINVLDRLSDCFRLMINQSG